MQLNGEREVNSRFYLGMLLILINRLDVWFNSFISVMLLFHTGVLNGRTGGECHITMEHSLLTQELQLRFWLEGGLGEIVTLTQKAWLNIMSFKNRERLATLA